MSFIGPALPPHLLQTSDDSDHEESTNCNDSKLLNTPEATTDKNKEDDLYGPALPPGLQKNSTIGPALPPGLRDRLGIHETDDPAENEGSESEDSDVVGPMPMPEEGESSYAARLIEERSHRMHKKLMGKNGKDAPKKREEWMLELPEGRTRQAMLGMNLAPRTFQARPAPKLDAAGRSAWTDTPADKERKLAAKGGEEGEEEEDDDDDYLEREALMQRDKTMEKITEEHNTLKRKESLLDIHLKKQKKEAKKKKKKEKKKRKVSTRNCSSNLSLARSLRASSGSQPNSLIICVTLSVRPRVVGARRWRGGHLIEMWTSKQTVLMKPRRQPS